MGYQMHPKDVTTMRQYEITATINASSEAIWKLLTDASGFPSWNSGVKKIDGQIAKGEKITVHTTFSEQAFPVNVSTFEAPKAMIWTGGMPLGLFKGERTFRLTEKTANTTEFHMREVFTGPLLGLIGRSIPDLNPSFELYVKGLKAKLES